MQTNKNKTNTNTTVYPKTGMGSIFVSKTQTENIYTCVAN